MCSFGSRRSRFSGDACWICFSTSASAMACLCGESKTTVPSAVLPGSGSLCLILCTECLPLVSVSHPLCFNQTSTINGRSTIPRTWYRSSLRNAWNPGSMVLGIWFWLGLRVVLVVGWGARGRGSVSSQHHRDGKNRQVLA